MTALNQVVEYMYQKVGTINVNNPKANSGGALLKLYKTYEEDMEKLVGIAFQTIQINFTKDTSSSPAGTVGLTQVSTAIGKYVSQYIKREPVPWNMQVRLGDLFIEAFYNCGYVDIYYPKARDTSYIVSATNEWIRLADIPAMVERVRLTGTYDQPPTNVIIKGDDKDYSTYDLPWVRAANKLQSTGWRINRRILKSLQRNKELFTSDTPIEDNDAKEMKRRSKAVEWAFIVTKAEKLASKDVFYQDVECDYRGRIYYSESFLSFQGSDLARGMLKFAHGKPMTDEGLYWLAVHTASSFNMSYEIDEIPNWVTTDYKSMLEQEGLDNLSVDKMTLNDRVQWTNEYMSEIVEAGKTGEFSEDAEKSVAFLSCCIEWYDYSLASQDNRIFFTHLPIPIDGSNNGWQHLGAISKDVHTGELVGLIPIEIQKDFYVQTAKELINQINDERLSNILSSMPMKSIRKGISKRGSMTRAYSAGASKIADNMFFDCKAEEYHTAYNITQDDCNKFAKTLVSAIDVVCPGPLQTMGYFQELAAFEIGKYSKYGPDGEPAGRVYKEIVKEQKELYIKKDKTDEELEELNDLTVAIRSYENRLVYGNGSVALTWDTPSGFPVNYTCFNTSTRKCRGTISGYKTEAGKAKTINHVARVPTTTPDIRGFMCGVSPNFVHSLDASHMMLVIDDWHGDFGAVHDSFSAHACDIEQLLALTKSKFIEMYNVDNFYDYIEDQLITDKTGLEVAQPELGNLNIKEIEDSDYFFA